LNFRRSPVITRSCGVATAKAGSSTVSISNTKSRSRWTMNPGEGGSSSDRGANALLVGAQLAGCHRSRAPSQSLRTGRPTLSPKRTGPRPSYGSTCGSSDGRPATP
jgi:hypothetical protein